MDPVFKSSSLNGVVAVDQSDKVQPIADQSDKIEPTVDQTDKIQPISDQNDKTQSISDHSDKIEPTVDQNDKIEHTVDQSDKIEHTVDQSDKIKLEAEADSVVRSADKGRESEVTSSDALNSQMDKADPVMAADNDTIKPIISSTETSKNEPSKVPVDDINMNEQDSVVESKAETDQVVPIEMDQIQLPRVLAMTLTDLLDPTPLTVVQKVEHLGSIPTYGLFALSDFTQGTFVEQIHGTVVNKQDIDCNQDLLTFYHVDGDFTLLPPFLFPFVDHSDSFIPTDIFMDSREMGKFDGRFIRSCCGNVEVPVTPNAKLVPVLAISDSETKDRPVYGGDSPIISDALNDSVEPEKRLRLCIFASRDIKRGEEIILENPKGTLLSNCACAGDISCRVEDFTYLIELFHNEDHGNFNLSRRSPSSH